MPQIQYVVVIFYLLPNDAWGRVPFLGNISKKSAENAEFLV